jgi:hypothetical protein
VKIDNAVTVLVGMNESGKTVFLESLRKSDDVLGLASFDPVEDYPRKDLPAYLKQHKTDPSKVTDFTYQLTESELTELNRKFQTELPLGFQFSISHDYSNHSTIGIDIDEGPVLISLLRDSKLSTEVLTTLEGISSIRAIPEALKGVSLNDDDKAFLAAVQKRIEQSKWDSVIKWEAWNYLKTSVPKFLYFSEYQMLPSKINLPDLARRLEAYKTDPKQLDSEHRGILGLLRMADISITDFTHPGGYEPLKAKLEGISINLTDQIMKFWKQNPDLEVVIDIKPDPEDSPPYNDGPNLYLRIANRRHRGVTTPFRQRSHGFIWFFSFLVWFYDIRDQLNVQATGDTSNLIILLDEPGLSLHALAQDDFLLYIDDLAKKYQVLYTTHSPFMVHSDRLSQVRILEDQKDIGTVISEHLYGSDPRTIFPLQAALGWNIAQNLFISERNLLVEGPADLIYLKALSAMLEVQGGTGLREDITIVPTGGLDKVVTFVALLGASGLKLVVLHDYHGAPDQKLMDLVKQKMISPKAILNASQFRNLSNTDTNGRPTDTEDLFEPIIYLQYFNKAFEKPLNGLGIEEKDLPMGDRIIDRIERFLETKGIQIRPSGGFNHYAVASYFASNPPASLDSNSLARFEMLFKTVNMLLP